jgi:hypothetical protein
VSGLQCAGQAGGSWGDRTTSLPPVPSNRRMQPTAGKARSPALAAPSGDALRKRKLAQARARSARS